MSTKQDDFVILHVNSSNPARSYDSLLQIPFKTELVTTLKKLKEAQGSQLKVVCHDRYDDICILDPKTIFVGQKITTKYIYIYIYS